MRNFTTRIYTKANYLLNRGRMALSNQRGDFYISDAVKIIIAVVLGASVAIRNPSQDACRIIGQSEPLQRMNRALRQLPRTACRKE